MSSFVLKDFKRMKFYLFKKVVEKKADSFQQQTGNGSEKSLQYQKTRISWIDEYYACLWLTCKRQFTFVCFNGAVVLTKITIVDIIHLGLSAP